MKKISGLLFGTAVTALCLMLVNPVRETLAAGEGNVVYLKDGGTGDGSSPDQAVGTLISAYSALDLENDATIVICGPFTQSQTFDYAIPFTGSVTFTSVYDGVDWREEGAVYDFEACRFICYGDTRFEYMNFNALGAYLLVVGQHNPVTVGEGVTIEGDQLTGGSIAKAFTILGGYQKGVGDPPFESDADTHITVLSGSKIYIVAFSRQLLGTYTGTAHIKVGGYADVSVLHGSAAYPDGIILGRTEIEITDNAHIRNIYGCTQDTDMEGFELIWKSGKIDKFEWTCSYTPGKYFKTVEDTVMRASEEVQENADFDDIAANFDIVLGLEEALPEKESEGEKTKEESIETEEERSTDAQSQEETEEDASNALESGIEGEENVESAASSSLDWRFPAGIGIVVICVIAAVVIAKRKKGK